MPAADRPRSIVYFIQQDPPDGPVKIGTTTVAPGDTIERAIELRLNSMRRDNPNKLVAIRAYEGDDKDEKWLHYRYGDLRLVPRREWFKAEVLKRRPPDGMRPVWPRSHTPRKYSDEQIADAIAVVTHLWAPARRITPAMVRTTQEIIGRGDPLCQMPRESLEEYAATGKKTALPRGQLSHRARRVLWAADRRQDGVFTERRLAFVLLVLDTLRRQTVGSLPLPEPEPTERPLSVPPGSAAAAAQPHVEACAEGSARPLA